MKIVKDYTLPDTFGMPPFRAVVENGLSVPTSWNTIDEIVLHHTDGNGNWEGLKGWFIDDPRNTRRHLYYDHIALTHYYIETNGRVIEAFPLEVWLYHSCSGKRDRTTVGIELVHRTGPFTKPQYDSLSELIEYLCHALVNIKTISTHDYRYLKYSGKAKGCPSKDFDHNYLKQLLDDKGYNYLEYNI